MGEGQNAGARGHGRPHARSGAHAHAARTRCSWRCRITMAVCALLLGAGGVACVKIVRPAHNERVEYIPDVPLWLRLEKEPGECVVVLFDGEFELQTCQTDTFLDGDEQEMQCQTNLDGQRVCSLVPRTLMPGVHTVEVISARDESHHIVEFSVFLDPDSPNRVPARCASADGLHVLWPGEAEAYHYWWYHSRRWMTTSWRSVISYKSPWDQINYQEILHEVKPSVLVELGTRFGGSTLFFSDVMRTVHRAGTPYQILTVDIDRTSIDSQVFDEPNVQVLTAPSASGRVRDRVRQLRAQYPGRMFVIHDADHSADNVTLEMQMVAPLLQKGDYVIVEDTNIKILFNDKEHGPGPFDAVVTFMAMNRQLFFRDVERETKFGFSQAMNGFLIVRSDGDQGVHNRLQHNPYLGED